MCAAAAAVHALPGSPDLAEVYGHPTVTPDTAVSVVQAVQQTAAGKRRQSPSLIVATGTVYTAEMLTECHLSCQEWKGMADAVAVQVLAICSVLVQMHQTQKVMGVAVAAHMLVMHAVAEKGGQQVMVTATAAAGG